MSKLIQPIGRALNQAQRRFVRSRAGSVLILVVALLVLMALIGTAFMSMAQSDRASAALHRNNTEVDLLMDGVVNLVRGATTGDLFVNGQYRPGTTYNFTNPIPAAPPEYNYVTGLGADPATAAFEANLSAPPTAVGVGDTWLASRIPDLLLDETATPMVANNLIVWRYITALNRSQFDSPYWRNANVAETFSRMIPAGMPGQGETAVFQPTSITVGGVQYPALQPYSCSNPPVALTAAPVLAADADGDGIADSGLFKLPVGPIDGVTYYAAVRIVDNSAAVNANIAWTYNPTQSAVAPQLPGDFFPSCIDFKSMLTQTDTTSLAFNSLLNYRFNQAPTAIPPAPNVNLPAYDDYSSNPSNPGLTLRTDINGGGGFTTALEAEWMQLGRRLKNPGPVGSSGLPFQAFPIGEEMNLAHNFILRDPSISAAASSPYLLEECLPNSLFNAVTSSFPYAPSNVQNWYQNNFWFYPGIVNGQNVVPIRSLLVTENPVSNFAPSKFRDLGSKWPAAPPMNQYMFGDTIAYTFTDPISGVQQTHRFVCINPSPAGASTVPPIAANYAQLVGTGSQYQTPSHAWALDNEVWAYEPWTTAPTKVSANTASFGQLWTAYWSVMAEQQYQIVQGLNQLGPVYPNSLSQQQVGGNNNLVTSPRMFRSPLRTPPPPTPNPLTPHLTPVQVMQLRAALAAVNTIDIRDSDDDVTSRTVHLYDASNPAQNMQDVIATVYGLERQPFITQVYATNASPAGAQTPTPYVAIELYNPTPQPISLKNWAFATIQRPDTVQTVPFGLVPTLVAPDFPWDGTMPAQVPIIPAGGFIIIASDATPPTGITLPPNVVVATGTPPTPPNVALYVEHNLSNALTGTGAELMLFRTRRDDGTISSTVAAGTPGPTAVPLPQQTNPYGIAGYPAFSEQAAGNVPNPADMVPVDSYDFTGFPPLPSSGTPVTEWYYARPNYITPMAGSNKNWHFVYPGHYQFASNPLVSNPPNTPRLIDGTKTLMSAAAGTILATLPGNLHPNLNVSQQNNNNNSTTYLPLGTFTAGPVNPDYRDVTLELNNTDFGGPNGMRVHSAPSGEPNAFPYGGFARNTDLVEVPFIGSYRLEVQMVVNSPPTIIEINPVTMDSVMALALGQQEWGEQPDNVPSQFQPAGKAANPLTDATGIITVENIGHFCPISHYDFALTGGPWPTLTVGGPAAGTYLVDDYQPEVTYNGSPAINIPNPGWLYHWTTHLFDYLTVLSPQQDYMPDVDPSPEEYNSENYPHEKYAATWMMAGTGVPPQPSPLANVSSGTANAEPSNAAGSTEEAAPTHGLININTAPWRVLAAVPWLPTTPNPTPQTYQDRATIALNIVRYRDVDDGTAVAPNPTHGHGPFRSIFELNNVPMRVIVPGSSIAPNTLFRDLMGNAMLTDYDQVHGNISPAYAGPDNIIGDFKSKFMMINRVSNLITTRSDGYTAYILIQGWRDAETDHPTLVVQRRAAYIIDRSSVTPSSKTPTMTKMPD